MNTAQQPNKSEPESEINSREAELTVAAEKIVILSVDKIII